MGTNFNSIGSAPWLQNYSPSMNFGFGATNGGFNVFGAQSTTSSSSSSSSSNTIQDYIEKEIENDKKRMAKIEKINAEQMQLDANMKLVQEQKAEIDKNKQADGSSKVKVSDEEFKQKSIWSKLFSGTMNALNGVTKVLKSVVGFNEEGKWEPLKCLKNVGIAVGATALAVCAPYAAPAIATALGASASTAVMAGAVAKGVFVVAPCIAGLAGGTYKAGKGLYDACNAETQEDFDKATQDIGAGAFVAMASRTGLKSISSSAGVVSQATSNSLGSKMIAGLKNTFVNPFKAGYKESLMAVQGMKSAASSAGLSSIKDASLLSNMKAGRIGVKNLHASVKIREYNKQFNKTKKDLENMALERHEKSLNAVDPREKAMYEYQRDNTLKTLSELDKVKSRAEWGELRQTLSDLKSETNTKSWYQFWKSGDCTINGAQYTNAELKVMGAGDFSKTLSGSIDNLAKLKSSTMSSVSTAPKFTDAVKDYGYSTKWYAKPWNWARAKWDQGMTKTEMFFSALSLTTPLYLLQPMLSNPTLAINNAIALGDSTYEQTWFNPVAKEQVDQVDAQYLAQMEAYNKKTEENQKNKQKLYNA